MPDTDITPRPRGVVAKLIGLWLGLAIGIMVLMMEVFNLDNMADQAEAGWLMICCIGLAIYFGIWASGKIRRLPSPPEGETEQ